MMPPNERAGREAGPVAIAGSDSTASPPLRASGWSLRCPVCWRLLLPADSLLHLAIAPRMAYHLWDEHPYEAAILRRHLQHPPDEWPELESGWPA